MNRNLAKKLAAVVTTKDLYEMLNRARLSLTEDDWKKTSILNKSMSKGTTWNILTKNFNLNKRYDTIIKFNLIREFGEFLSAELKDKFKKKSKPLLLTVHHQDPTFEEWDETRKVIEQISKSMDVQDEK